jgi:hypothetical protein
MPSASGIRAGQAFVELFADDSRLVKGLQAASRRLKAWGSNVTALGRQLLTRGIATISSVIAAGRTFEAVGDNLQKMSIRTGVSVEALSELGFAAEQSGADLALLESGLRYMQRVIAAAASGSELAIEIFDQLGLALTDIAKAAPEQQFMMIADAVSRIESPVLRATLAMKVFGRQGTMLVPLVQQGAAGIEELRRQARELGITMSTEDANAAAALRDSLNILWRVMKKGVSVIGSAVAPVLKDTSEHLTHIIKMVTEWIKRNKDLVVTIFKVAAAVAAVGSALIALGGTISILGFAFGALASIVTGVGTVVRILVAILGALVSPIGLVIAAVVSLGGYLLYISGTGEKALAWLGERFLSLRDTALAAWKGISDALAAGDIGLAARILWLTLKMEWQKGVAWLTDKWIEFKETFMAVATEAVYSTAKILTSSWAWMQTAWVETVSRMSSTWTLFTHHVVTGWRTAQNWIAKKLVQLMALFDSTIDAAGAMQILDEEFTREQRARDRAMQQQLRDIEATRQARRAAIEEEEKGTLAVLEEERQRRHVARRQQYDADLKAAEEAVAEARRQWQEALDEAARKRAEITATVAPGRAADLGDFEGLDLEGLVRRSISVVGTFNPLAVAGLGSGSPLERTARATEETAKNTRRLVQHFRDGLVFM